MIRMNQTLQGMYDLAKSLHESAGDDAEKRAEADTAANRAARAFAVVSAARAGVRASEVVAKTKALCPDEEWVRPFRRLICFQVGYESSVRAEWDALNLVEHYKNDPKWAEFPA